MSQQATNLIAINKKGNHSSNYTPEEDVQLCKSYLHVSTYPIVGTSQKAADFWEKIKNHYDSQRRDLPGYVERFGLKSRWATINRSVSRYLEHYVQVKALDASRSDDFDVVAKTNELYHTESLMLNRKPAQFPFIHCWAILEKSPQWRVKVRGNVSTTATTATPTSDGSDSSESASDDGGAVRPVGVKKTKSKRNYDAMIKSSAEELNNVMTASLKEWSLMNQQKREVMEKQYNDSVMSRSLASITDPVELEYFKLRRVQILAELKKQLQETNSEADKEAEDREL